MPSCIHYAQRRQRLAKTELARKERGVNRIFLPVRLEGSTRPTRRCPHDPQVLDAPLLLTEPRRRGPVWRSNSNSADRRRKACSSKVERGMQTRLSLLCPFPRCRNRARLPRFDCEFICRLHFSGGDFSRVRLWHSDFPVSPSGHT